jgi:hypothetical protein
MFTPFVKPDNHVLGREQHTYTVRSVYFDTPDMLFYREKIEGVPYRLKLRVRSYDTRAHKAPVFLEIKRKHKIPMTKDRAPMSMEMMKQIVCSGQDAQYSMDLLAPKYANSASKFMYHLHKDSLTPVVLVVYDREPYEALDDPSIRITLDKNLRSAPRPLLEDLFLDELTPVMRDYFILEVKYDKVYPRWMELVVHQLGLKQEAASKYCMSIDNHPELLQYGPLHWRARRQEALTYA